MGIQAYRFHFHVSLKINGIYVNFNTKLPKNPDAHVNSSEKMTISEKEHTIQY